GGRGGYGGGDGGGYGAWAAAGSPSSANTPAPTASNDAAMVAAMVATVVVAAIALLAIRGCAVSVMRRSPKPLYAQENQPLDGDQSVDADGLCTSARFRSSSSIRQLQYELRKQRGTSNFMILVRLLNLRFLNECAARDIGTSNSPHLCPVSEVRDTSRHALTRTSETKGH